MAKPKSEKETSVIERTLIPFGDVRKDISSRVTEPKRRKVIDFRMQDQCHSNWCWAAVAASVSAFYGNSVTQCEIANQELKRADCCATPCHTDNVAFNDTHTLGSPLNQVDCLDREVRFEKATFKDLQKEIDASRPLCARIIWPDGTAHFVVIVGYVLGEALTTLILADSLYGSQSETGYDRFCTDYQGIGGKWNDTYYTKPPERSRQRRKEKPNAN
jgi:hypothetical protein